MKTYDVVIVNLNGEAIIYDCLDSIFSSTTKPSKVIIYDNNSSDKSIKLIKNKFPKVQLIEGEKNIGFGPANNAALELVEAPFVLFVNNDVLLDKNCTRELLRGFEDKRVAVIDPLIYKGWDKKKDQNVYAFGAELNDTGFAYALYDAKTNRTDLNNFSAACVMMRTDLIKKIKFEPTFFLYGEEPMIGIELSRRGCKIAREQKAKCYHLESYSSPQKKSKAIAFRQFYGIQNRYFMIGKYFPARLWLKALIFNTAHLCYIALFDLLSGNFSYAKIVYLAPFKLVKGLLVRPRNRAKDVFWYKKLSGIPLKKYFSLRKKVFKD